MSPEEDDDVLLLPVTGNATMSGNLTACGEAIKWCILVSNILVIMGGIATVSTGIWLSVDPELIHYFTGFYQQFHTAGLVVISSGIFMTLVALVGCFGAWKESTWLLITYLIILVSLIILIGATFLVTYLFQDSMKRAIKGGMDIIVREQYQPDVGDFVSDDWDYLQEMLKCCGEEGYEDWKTYNTAFQNNRGPWVPKSCCKSHDNDSLQNCQGGAYLTDYIYTKGCFDIAISKIQSASTIIAIVGGAIAGILALTTTLTYTLHRMIRHQVTYSRMKI